MMNNNFFEDVANAPVFLNVYPDQSVDVICKFIEVMHEEGYTMIEVLARPLDQAIMLMTELNKRPERTLVTIGLGTIKTRSAALEAVKLNPDFLVSPAYSRKVLDVAVEADLPYIPAVCSLQDIQDVIDDFEDVGRDVKALKVCPVMILNYEFVEIMGTIYPGIVYCPTGTVTLETLPVWKKIPCVGPAMESSFVPPEMLEKQDWSAVKVRLQKIKRISQVNE